MTAKINNLPKKLLILLLFYPLLVPACRETSKSSVNPGESGKIGVTVRSSSGDPILDEIAFEARGAISVFIRHMRNPQKGEEQFRIKYPFQADSGSGIDKEYLWLSDVTFKHGKYSALVANRPYYTSGLEPGDEVFIMMDDIADWMFLRDGKIIGGRSIKYLIEKIPPIDRDEEMERLLRLFE